MSNKGVGGGNCVLPLLVVFSKRRIRVMQSVSVEDIAQNLRITKSAQAEVQQEREWTNFT